MTNPAAPLLSESDVNNKNPQMDWQQVVLNGGPPCFVQLDDEDGYYCGRAERWEGHDGEHKFVSLDDLITTIRQEERLAAFREAVAIIVGQPTTHYIYSGATPMAAETFRDNAIGAIEAVIAIEQAKQRKVEAAANETREDKEP